MERLLFFLENSGLGFHIEDLFAGALAFADNLTALLTAIRHLQLLLDSCVEFGQECDIVFNCDKSQCEIVRNLICKLSKMLLENNI